MLSFPLYPIRYYELIEERGNYKYIRGNKKEWVYDYVNHPNPSYSDRRMDLIREGIKPYPLYKGCYTVSQMLENRKYKTYLDRSGKIVRWKPVKMYSVKSYKITQKWIPTELPRLIFTIEPSCEVYEIPAPNYVANYARVVEIGNRRILFDVTEERMPDTRVKL